MRHTKQFVFSTIAMGVLSALPISSSLANTVYEASSGGKPYADLNLRYENVSQDTAAADANALTLRTRLGYISDNLHGWSFQIEMEDSRIVAGQGDYTVGPTGYNVGEYSVIADPETTELDQGFVQYQNKAFTFKLGRQVIALDGQRFVGHVGWRQDRQTFDAASFIYQPNDKLKASYHYINQRNRIFAEAADLDSKDHLLNASYQTTAGKLLAYAYLLELDNNQSNSLDTYGASFSGKQGDSDLTWLYHIEVANQSSSNASQEFDAMYYKIDLGAALNGYTLNAAYESLGSDDGLFGFSTPLATLHKFNGWADSFLATPLQGLNDLNVSLKTQALGGTWLLAYHDYSADKASETVDDLGDEINLQYTTKFLQHYSLGLKYAAYSGDSGRADTDKVWLWLNTKF